jgi:Leucine-rich repeat (LRR) protein
VLECEFEEDQLDRAADLKVGDCVVIQGIGGPSLERCRVLWAGKSLDEAEQLARAREGRPAVDGDDRKAAKWVLSVGGKSKVRLHRDERWITSANDLPREPFQLRKIELAGKKAVTDAGLAHVRGLTNLIQLGLYDTGIGDEGLVNLEDLTSLTTLVLGKTRVSNAGVKHLQRLTTLTELALSGLPVNDAGLAQLQGLHRLTTLILDSTNVTDTGLAHVSRFANLTELGLANTKVGDPGLDHLKGLNRLVLLGLQNTQVTDAGLVHL